MRSCLGRTWVCVSVCVLLGFAFSPARQLQVLSFPCQTLGEFHHDLNLRLVWRDRRHRDATTVGCGKATRRHHGEFSICGTPILRIIVCVIVLLFAAHTQKKHESRAVQLPTTFLNRSTWEDNLVNWPQFVFSSLKSAKENASNATATFGSTGWNCFIFCV